MKKKFSIKKRIEPCDCCQEVKELVAYNGYRICSECKALHQGAMAKLREFFEKCNRSLILRRKAARGA